MKTQSSKLKTHNIKTLFPLSLFLLIMACAAPAGISNGPRWACPSPTPRPWGDTGPVKEYQQGQPDPTTGLVQRQPIYYEQWEQEYGPDGSLLNGLPAFRGPPFPAPTPYGRMGNTYAFGQRVELAPLHATVQAMPAELLDSQRMLYLIAIVWHNPTEQPMPISYPQQLWLRSVSRADGTLLTGDGWGIDLKQAAQHKLQVPDSIAPGDSQVVLPIVAPPERPQVVELQLAMLNSDTSTTPTPNTDLRETMPRMLTVQWVNAASAGPPCDSPGALTDWSTDDPKAIPRDAMLGLKAPPGTPRVVQLALAQVGKRYVWGAQGPDTFDCSGLMYWAYGQIGIRIPRTTYTQWPALRPVGPAQWQPGDLVYMDTRDVRNGFRGYPESIEHVGMLADINGDGKWDMIHAASPKLGLRLEMDVLSSPYYSKRMFPMGRTVR